MKTDPRITQDTYPPKHQERLGKWYVQIVHLPDYHLVTGPRRDPAYEYEREQLLSAAATDYDYEH